MFVTGYCIILVLEKLYIKYLTGFGIIRKFVFSVTLTRVIEALDFKFYLTNKKMFRKAAITKTKYFKNGKRWSVGDKWVKMNKQNVNLDTGIFALGNCRKKNNIFILINIYHTYYSWLLATFKEGQERITWKKSFDLQRSVWKKKLIKKPGWLPGV